MAQLAEGPDGKPLLTVASAADLSSWLAAEPARQTGVWLLRPRRASPGDPLPYERLVVELLRHGWIDSTVKLLDERHAVQWIAPRRKGSVWSQSNKDRVAALEAEDGLAPAGAAVVARARADGSWTLLDGPERLEVPADLAAALAGDQVAAAGFAASPASTRKMYLGQIALAKTPATRARRIADTVRRSAEGWRPGRV